MTHTRGKFIVIEGCDGAGTTTQAKRLAEYLRARGRTVLETREPTDGAIGTLIRSCAKGETLGRCGQPMTERAMALLFAADRVDHVDNEIFPALACGQWVVSDRYLGSSLVYQGMAGSIDLGWVQQINGHALQPDLTIVLEVSEATARARRLARGGPADRYEEDGRQAAIHRGYARLGTNFEGGYVALVDGEQSVAAVAERIRNFVEVYLGVGGP
jgi:dTMP kinase